MTKAYVYVGRLLVRRHGTPSWCPEAVNSVATMMLISIGGNAPLNAAAATTPPENDVRASVTARSVMGDTSQQWLNYDQNDVGLSPSPRLFFFFSSPYSSCSLAPVLLFFRSSSFSFLFSLALHSFFPLISQSNPFLSPHFHLFLSSRGPFPLNYHH